MTLTNDVLEILHRPLDHEWSIQGFGMLRMYLADDQVRRLHIWDMEEANEAVSTIHDHPWDFTSEIISGEMENVRYVINENPNAYINHKLATIQCGVGGGLRGEPIDVALKISEIDYLKPGMTYSQRAEEMHESLPSRGCVSVITRSFKADRDIARVAWSTRDWVTAEPRPATEDEVIRFTTIALGNWNAPDEV